MGDISPRALCVPHPLQGPRWQGRSPREGQRGRGQAGVGGGEWDQGLLCSAVRGARGCVGVPLPARGELSGRAGLQSFHGPSDKTSAPSGTVILFVFPSPTSPCSWLKLISMCIVARVHRGPIPIINKEAATHQPPGLGYELRGSMRGPHPPRASSPE